MRSRSVFASALAVSMCAGMFACGQRATSPSQTSTVLPPAPPAPPNAAALDSLLLVCPAATQIQSLDPIQIEFAAALQAGPLVCRATDGSVDLTAAQRFLYRALLFLHDTRFDAPLPWTSSDAWTWFVSLGPRVWFYTGSGNSNCNPCSRGNASLNLNVGETPMTWVNVATLASVLVHEARHIEVGNHRCGTQDFRVDDLEAFGVHYSYLTWVWQHTNPSAFPAEFRPYMTWSTCAMRNSAFCNDRCAG